MPLDELQLDSLARRRAKAKLGWFTHAAVYVAVNTGLVTISLVTGRHWAIFPLFGWGLGLLAHGISVWMQAPHTALLERMVDKERTRLARTHRGDAW